MTKGNEHAADFLCAYVNHCHLIDDFVDGDVPIDDERIVREHLVFFEQLFYRPHRMMFAQQALLRCSLARAKKSQSEPGR